MATFVIIQYGGNKELIANTNCRKVNFIEYLRQKCQCEKNAFIDLIDENGNLVLVHLGDPHANVVKIFDNRLRYIPVMLEKLPQWDTYTAVKPMLDNWEKSFPQLEQQIKILTDELNRNKKPVRGIDPRARSGRGRKVYINTRPVLGQPSTPNTGKQTAKGRKSNMVASNRRGKKK